MLVQRVLGGICLVLALYYLRFFVERQEQGTFLQLTILLCAAGLLLLPARAARWLAVGAIALGIGLFVVMDRDSGSVSDTLNRTVPSLALLVATVVCVGRQRTPA